MTTATETVDVSKVFPAHHCHFSLKITIRRAAFKIGRSVEAIVVAAPWFKDQFQYFQYNCPFLNTCEAVQKNLGVSKFNRKHK